tara:strand:- start:145 stop:381 length:237 start_codon:yes stop_codon:yes gene_type:complete
MSTDEKIDVVVLTLAEVSADTDVSVYRTEEEARKEAFDFFVELAKNHNEEVSFSTLEEAEDYCYCYSLGWYTMSFHIV